MRKKIFETTDFLSYKNGIPNWEGIAFTKVVMINYAKQASKEAIVANTLYIIEPKDSIGADEAWTYGDFIRRVCVAKEDCLIVMSDIFLNVLGQAGFHERDKLHSFATKNLQDW